MSQTQTCRERRRKNEKEASHVFTVRSYFSVYISSYLLAFSVLFIVACLFAAMFAFRLSTPNEDLTHVVLPLFSQSL